MEIGLPALTPFEYMPATSTDYHEIGSIVERTLHVQYITEGFVYGIIYIGGSPFKVRISTKLARELAEPGDTYYLIPKKPNLPPI